jgi:hypothetical protein
VMIASWMVLPRELITRLELPGLAHRTSENVWSAHY